MHQSRITRTYNQPGGIFLTIEANAMGTFDVCNEDGSILDVRPTQELAEGTAEQIVRAEEAHR